MAWHTQTFIHSHTRALTRPHEYIKSWKSIINRITSHRRAIFPLEGGTWWWRLEKWPSREAPSWWCYAIKCISIYLYPSSSPSADTVTCMCGDPSYEAIHLPLAGSMLAGRLSYGPRCHPEHPGSLIWASTTAVQSSSVLCPPVSVWRKDVGHGIDEKPHIYGR